MKQWGQQTFPTHSRGLSFVSAEPPPLGPCDPGAYLSRFVPHHGMDEVNQHAQNESPKNIQSYFLYGVFR